ncbi:unnamed protein product [Rotaria sp. Silwood2]|nr:unnamed protein product [Rotaria sp. Silwood2]CAF2649209.1 unnamed protein product [Rotaria sp. Silwood2]CAF3061766.1 unnamed protein product [Rotaria sp. Silwood2]CAF4058650.1 unnamed protein product [Rotaria sp. Silwood2]CAF4108271.1 unnamed protein product [Rotaria sp. Silwood2]
MAYYSNSLQAAFVQSDRNRDGVLDRHEFRNFLDFQNADRNQDGRISYGEFANIAAPNLYVPPRNAAQAFRIADQNHDGFLDRRELADFSDFQYADLNHDGRVDPNEMRMFLASNQMANYSPYYQGQQHQYQHNQYMYPRRRY